MREQQASVESVDVALFGVVEQLSPRAVSDTIPTVITAAERVLLSGEYVPPGESQYVPMRQTWRDTLKQDALIGSRHYSYVQRPDQTLALQQIEQATRLPDGLQRHERLARQFDAQARPAQDVFVMDAAVRAKRTYHYGDEATLLMDEVYDEQGNVTERIAYSKGVHADHWSVQRTQFTATGERAFTSEPVIQVPPLSGAVSELPFLRPLTLPAGSVELRSPATSY